MKKKIFLIIMVLFIISCASSPIDVSSKKFVPVGETVVFGRVKVVNKGLPINWKKGFSKYGFFTIFIVPETAGKSVAHDLKDDGSFYWYLPKGRYYITGFQWKRANFTRGSQLPIRFEVPEGQAPVYIGTLTITVQGGAYSFQVDNEFQKAQQKLSSKIPEVKVNPVENLMQVEVSQ